VCAELRDTDRDRYPDDDDAEDDKEKLLLTHCLHPSVVG